MPRLTVFVAALLCGLAATASAQSHELEIEILPAENGESSAALVARLEQLMGTPEGRQRLSEFQLLGMLPDALGSVEVTEPGLGIDVSSASGMRAVTTTDVEVVAGDSLDVTAGGAVGLLGGSLSMHTAGKVDAATGTVDLQAAGDVAATASGSAFLAASGAYASVAGQMQAAASGDIGLTGGGNLELNAAAAGSVSFGGGLDASASRVDVTGREALSASAPRVDITAKDAMRVETTGAALELSGTAGVEFVTVSLRTPSSFGSFESAVPATAGVTSVVIASEETEGADVLSGQVALDIGTGAGGTFAWVTVWSMVVPEAGASLDGTTIEFSSLDVTAVRFRGSAGTVNFEGWSGVTLSFGIPTAAGSVSMRTAGSINALAAGGLVASADTVSLSAARTLDANVVGTASLGAQSLKLSSRDRLSAVAGSVDLDVSTHALPTLDSHCC